MNGHSQLRKGHRSLADRIYHVSSSIRGSRNFLYPFECRRAVVRSFQREQAASHAETLAFVVMPDRFHWLFSLNDRRSLSVSVNTVKSFSAREINRVLGRRGKVWQRGFVGRAIRREEHLEHVARYIVANPLRAGMVDAVGDYPFWDAKWL